LNPATENTEDTDIMAVGLMKEAQRPEEPPDMPDPGFAALPGYKISAGLEPSFFRILRGREQRNLPAVADRK